MAKTLSVKVLERAIAGIFESRGFIVTFGDDKPTTNIEKDKNGGIKNVSSNLINLNRGSCNTPDSVNLHEAH